jgi:hypothetical protein
MAIPRKLWSALKPATQKRKLSFYRKRGLSDAQIRSRYNAGTLGPQTAVRGHAQTPERPERAAKRPERYQEYLSRRARRRGTGGPVFSARDRAYGNVHRKIGTYQKYNDNTVRRHVYQMMTDAEVEWTINASEDMIVGRAEANYGIRPFGNIVQSPWWYH